MPKVNSGRLPISHSRLRITISATRVKKRNRGASRSKKSFIGYHLVYFWSTKASKGRMVTAPSGALPG